MHDLFLANRFQPFHDLPKNDSCLLLRQIATPGFNESYKISSIAKFQYQVIVIARLGRCPEVDNVFVSDFFQEPHFVLEQLLHFNTLKLILINNFDSEELVRSVVLV